MHKFLLVLLPFCVVAGDAKAWNKYEFEYDFVEAILLIVLVAFALGFEIVHHHLSHAVKHAYHYGDEHQKVLFGKVEEDHGHQKVEDSHGNLKHPRLGKELVKRMSGEFMTLGWLALMIFSLNQAEVFDQIAEAVDSCDASAADSVRPLKAAVQEARATAAVPAEAVDCWHYPVTGNSWLHMAEVVHVKLFLAMILYFLFIARVVHKSNYKIRSWENLRLRRLKEVELGTDEFSVVCADLAMFKSMREYIMKDVLLMKTNRRSVFRKLVKKLKLTEVPTHQWVPKLREEMDKRLSLSAYFAYNVEKGVVDSIEVHMTTWLGILGMFVVSAALTRAKVEFTFIFPAVVFLGIIFVVFMLGLVRMQTNALNKFVEGIDQNELENDVRLAMEQKSEKLGQETDLQDTSQADVLPLQTPPAAKLTPGFFPEAISFKKNLEVDKRTFFQRNIKERDMMRVLQAVLFMINYALAETLVDKHKWLEVPMQTLISTLVYMILYLVMTFTIPKMIPSFLQLMALPPYIDRHNVEALLSVALDDHACKGKGEDHNHSFFKADSSMNTSLACSEASEHLSHHQAAVELAGLVAKCGDFQELARVKEQLLMRLQEDGRLADFSRHSDEHPSQSREAPTGVSQL